MSNKIIAIGDTHGRRTWEKVKNQESEFDKFIFIGDYFDTREGIRSQDQLDNFTKILIFKRDNPDKVVLLLGNHDFHYLTGVTDQYSQFDFSMYEKANRLLMGAIEKNWLDIVHVEGDYMFSHAGVSEEWVRNSRLDESNLVDSINSILGIADDGSTRLSDSAITKLSFGYNLPKDIWPSNTGDNITQSPIWIRPMSLSKVSYGDYIHVVGHTQVEEIQLINKLLMIDILGTNLQYIVIENDEFEVRTIK